ncbi:MAG: OmpA family protein [Bacteroidia bacterium]
MRTFTILLFVMMTPFLWAQNDSIKRYRLPELSHLNFAHNAYELQASHKSELEIIARHMQQHPELGLLIIGHTDDTGSNTVNTTFGSLRAQSIVNYLCSIGIEKSRISFGSQGEENPLFNDTTNFARSQNRRVELKFYFLNI